MKRFEPKEYVSKWEIYAWNIAGSVCNALASVVLLMLVNRVLGVKSGDVFSLAFSIAQLMLTVGTFQVRVYQSTDVTDKFQFHDYFEFRVLTCSIMLVVSFIYTMIQGYTGQKMTVIMLLCLYRVIDAFSDVFQGLFQQNERIDLAGKSVFFRTVIPTACFGVVMYMSGSLLTACVVFVLSELLLLFLYDVRVYYWFRGYRPAIAERSGNSFLKNAASLGMLCGPLFINGYLLTALYNEPKLAIDRLVTSGALADGIQTYYSILFMPAFVINLLLVVLRPLITTMAYAWSQDNHRKLYGILAKICVILGIWTIISALLAWTLGIPVLTWIYGTGDSLKPYRTDLVILILAGGINALANVLDNVVTIFRYQHALLFAYGAAYVTALLTAERFVRAYALRGAVYTYLLSVTVLFACVFCVFAGSLVVTRRKKKNNG